MALLSVAVALVIARYLDAHLVAAPASLFLCAILFSARFGGIGPGLVAVALSHLAFIYYVVTPTSSWAVEMEEVPRIIIFSLTALFVVAVSAAQRSATESLRRINEALESLAGRLINAQEEERSRIWRELHDHISQMLGVLAIKIDQLRAHGQITPDIGQKIDELRRDTGAITADVHGLSHRLHSSTLDYLGLAPALQKLVSEFSARHGIAIAFAHASLPASMPSDVKLCLFRVAEEALTNIAKHSKAHSANIHVTGAPDGIHLRVEDGGTGFDTSTPASKAGLGFVSMQERLARAPRDDSGGLRSLARNENRRVGASGDADQRSQATDWIAKCSRRGDQLTSDSGCEARQDRRRQPVGVREQHRQLPALRVRKRVLERGHAGHADAVGDLPEGDALGIVGHRVFEQLRRRRKHAFRDGRGLRVREAVADRAVLGVLLRAPQEIGLVHRQRIFQLRRVPVTGGEGEPRDRALERQWGRAGRHGHAAGADEDVAARGERDERDDEPQREPSHP